MSNSFDKAKEEANRIAHEMRVGAERIKEGVGSKIQDQRDAIKNKDYSYGTMVQHLRLIQLIAMSVQMIVYWFELNKVGIIRLMIPTPFVLLAFYVVSRRWYYQVDGRYDFQQLLNTSNPLPLRVQYFLGLFGGFFLPMLVHFVLAPLSPTYTLALFYNLAGYALMLAGGACAGIETYEGMKANKGKSR